MTQGPTDPRHDAGSEPGPAEDAVGQDVNEDADQDADHEPEWKRRRRLAEAFGSGEHHDGGKGDSWYRDQLPPHHGG